jgi:Tol biopolymer transport system component
VPKITDFGLAKRLDVASGQTVTGAVMGTPSYMAPEQALGRAHTAGPLADVYALGAILYECLTGRPPFVGPSSYATLEQVVAQEPVPPIRLQPGVPRDLETVCLKCLRKEPEKRYASAQGLADDLARFLEGRPVQARPVRPAERLVKWARRRPAVAGLSAFSLALAVVAFALVSWKWREAVRARGAEAHQRALAELAEGEARQKALDEEQAREEAQRQLYLSNIALANREWLADNPERVLDLLNECPIPLRGWEWHYLKGLRSGGLLRLRPHGPGFIGSLAYSPDGKLLASADTQGTVVVSDAQSGQARSKLPTQTGPYLGVAFSPDGKLLVTAGEDGAVRLWAPQTGAARGALRGHNGPALCVTFRQDGLLASGGKDGTIRLWSLPSDRPRRTVLAHSGPVTCLAFSPDGKLLASGSANPDTTARIWKVDGTAPLQTLPAAGSAVTAVAFSPDGSRLARVNGAANRLHLYEPSTGKQAHWVAFNAARAINGLSFSPDGRRIALACRSRHLLVYDLETTQSTFYRGHVGGLEAVAFSPDGSRIASASISGEVRVWDAADVGPPD